jgi:DNA replication initiation complex subunit (GINS family)
MNKKNPMKNSVEQIETLISNIKYKKKIKDAPILHKAFKPIEDQINALYEIDKNIERATAGNDTTPRNTNLTPEEKELLDRLKEVTDKAEAYEKAITKAIEKKTRESKKTAKRKTEEAPKQRKKKFKPLGSDGGWLPL